MTLQNIRLGKCWKLFRATHFFPAFETRFNISKTKNQNLLFGEKKKRAEWQQSRLDFNDLLISAVYYQQQLISVEWWRINCIFSLAFTCSFSGFLQCCFAFDAPVVSDHGMNKLHFAGFFFSFFCPCMGTSMFVVSCELLADIFGNNIRFLSLEHGKLCKMFSLADKVFLFWLCWHVVILDIPDRCV